MKVLAVLLLCALAAVQGRSTGEKSRGALAIHGEAPWVVHLRIAVATSGYLETAAGVLISDRWVLSAGEPLSVARFIWLRYGTVSVFNPTLVTESSAVTPSSDGAIALISVNRAIQSTTNISPASLATKSFESGPAYLYLFGKSDGAPGETLQSFSATLTSKGDGVIIATSDEGAATEYDLGAPVVVDGVLIGVVTKAGDEESAAELKDVYDYVDWIETQTASA